MEQIRLVVLADLPIGTRHERKVARDFERWLFADGFSKLQVGVYTRACRERDSAALHKRQLKKHRPETGSVRLFSMTERQFKLGELISGEEPAQELEIGSQLDIFL